jgi:hypothetical protein
MNSRNRISGVWWMAILAAGLAVPVWAQPPAEKPKQEAVPAKQQPPEPKDPAVAAILRANPSTPEQLARAAKRLAALGRPDLGKQFVKRLIDAKLSDQQLADLAEQFGSATFLGMAARKEMQPEAEQLAQIILQAVDRSLKDPARIAGLIRQLQDPSPEQRGRAMAGLQEARSAAVGPLLAVLADTRREGEHNAVRAVLVQMGSDAVGPLLSLLEASDPNLVAQAIRVLAEMDANASGGYVRMPYPATTTAVYLLRPYYSEASEPPIRAAAGGALQRLLGRMPTRQEAVGLLTEQARAYFDRRQPMKEDANGRVQLWHWDADSKQCVLKSYPVDEAACATAARLARDAYALASDDPQIRLLYLATMLEGAAYAAGLDQPLPEGQGTAMAEAARFGPRVIERLLEYAVAGGHVPAATAAARILGRIGTADELLRQGAQPTALVRAMRHADRRLRMAAADAVLRLQPVRPFPGASYVPEVLGFFAASRGTRRALVAGPSTERSRQLAGMLARMGLEVDTAVTGRGLMRLAIASPDYELALIDAGIDQPTVDLLLQQLRHDCRSATLRVGLIARDGFLQRARRVAGHDPLTLAFSRPHSDESFAQEMEQLTALVPRAFVGLAERQRQAAWALDRLVELSGPGNKLYDVRRTEDAVLAALYVPGLGSKAAAVLGNLGTAEGQQALVEVASRPAQPLEVRRAALKAFEHSIQARGILLTSRQILRQYDRYNQSQSLDVPTRQILSLILDCIEAPTQPIQAGEDGGAGNANGGKPKVDSRKPKAEDEGPAASGQGPVS